MNAQANYKFDVVVKKSKIHGKGAFATRLFEPAERIGVYEGRITIRNGTKVMWLYDDMGACFGIKGDGVLSYMNHSTDPNAVFGEGGPYVHALRVIEKGEEITVNYGEDWDVRAEE